MRLAILVFLSMCGSVVAQCPGGNCGPSGFSQPFQQSFGGGCPGGVCPAPSFGYQQFQPQYQQPIYQPYQPVYRQQPYGGYGYYQQQFRPQAYQPTRQMTYQQPCDHWGPDGQVGYIEPQPGGDPYWYTR